MNLQLANITEVKDICVFVKQVMYNAFILDLVLKSMRVEIRVNIID